MKHKTSFILWLSATFLLFAAGITHQFFNPIVPALICGALGCMAALPFICIRETRKKQNTQNHL